MIRGREAGTKLLNTTEGGRRDLLLQPVTEPEDYYQIWLNNRYAICLDLELAG